jgi:hypothetical protein
MGHPSQLHAVFQPVEGITTSQPKTGKNAERRRSSCALSINRRLVDARAVCASGFQINCPHGSLHDCLVRGCAKSLEKTQDFGVRSGEECVKQGVVCVGCLPPGALGPYGSSVLSIFGPVLSLRTAANSPAWHWTVRAAQRESWCIQPHCNG